MLKKSMQDALNKQLNEELYSWYLYLSMAAWFEEKNLNGMAGWMRLQAQEEMAHAMKFYSFIHERGGNVTLDQIKAPKATWKSSLAAFQDAYKHECAISERIHKLTSLAIKHEDHPSNVFLQWFVTEQVEEEATALGIVEQLKAVGDHAGALFMLDRELGQRQPGA